MSELERVANELQKRHPGFKIVKKRDSPLMKTVNVLLMIITFGRMRSFMSDYVTTIGKTVYVTEHWDSNPALVNAATLRHEGVHIAQAEREGMVFYALKYLFWLLPAGLSRSRRDYEMEAYEESIRAHVEYFGIEFVEREEYKSRMISQFTSSSYMWMWPFKKSIESWFNKIIVDVKNKSA